MPQSCFQRGVSFLFEFQYQLPRRAAALMRLKNINLEASEEHRDGGQSLSKWSFRYHTLSCAKLRTQTRKNLFANYKSKALIDVLLLAVYIRSNEYSYRSSCINLHSDRNSSGRGLSTEGQRSLLIQCCTDLLRVYLVIKRTLKKNIEHMQNIYCILKTE